MQRLEPKIMPLTTGEKDWLMEIYSTRFKYLWIAFPGYTLILTIISLSPLGFTVYAIVNDLMLGGKDTWMVEQHYISGWYYKIGIAIMIAAVFCILSYFFRMLPYKADADSGAKLNVPYVVNKKEYYPATGQYFVWLGGINRHYEVDEETYNKCDEGGIIYMSQAARSGYIFSENDEFMPFSF